MLLHEFVECWNNNTLPVPHNKVTDAVPLVFPPQQFNATRPSSLGKAAIVTLLYSILPPQGDKFIGYGKQTELLMTGHVVENRVVTAIDNFMTTSRSLPCNYKGVTGTADLFLEDEGRLVDVKTANSSNAKWLASNPSLKYVTQLAVYSRGISRSVDDVSLLIYNKDNSKLTLVDIADTALTSALDRADTVLEHVKELKKLDSTAEQLDYVFKTVEVPEVREERYQSEATGKYLLPLDLMYEPTIIDALFHTEKGSNRRNEPVTYVTELKSHEETLEYLLSIQATNQ